MCWGREGNDDRAWVDGQHQWRIENEWTVERGGTIPECLESFDQQHRPNKGGTRRRRIIYPPDRYLNNVFVIDIARKEHKRRGSVGPTACLPSNCNDIASTYANNEKKVLSTGDNSPRGLFAEPKGGSVPKLPWLTWHVITHVLSSDLDIRNRFLNVG